MGWRCCGCGGRGSWAASRARSSTRRADGCGGTRSTAWHGCRRTRRSSRRCATSGRSGRRPPRRSLAAMIDAPRRLLLVHAHPDDETIATGATMAKYVAEGAHVTLVTCTLGEEGEVLAPELEHLAADKEDRLGEHRAGELAEAMQALGVVDHR